jgi:hypothetical protein
MIEEEFSLKNIIKKQEDTIEIANLAEYRVLI